MKILLDAPRQDFGELAVVHRNCDNGYNCVYVNTLSWSSPTTPHQFTAERPTSEDGVQDP